jgi:hypothetical protein
MPLELLVELVLLVCPPGGPAPAGGAAPPAGAPVPPLWPVVALAVDPAERVSTMLW